MTGLKRNMQSFSYCLYTGKIPVVDANGNNTGEKIPTYGNAVGMSANVSAATGQNSVELFGNLDNYDKIIVSCETDCPIDENTVLFIDKAPEYGEEIIIGYEEPETVLGDPVPITYKPPLYDYTVRRVAKTQNVVAIAVRKVKVS